MTLVALPVAPPVYPLVSLQEFSVRCCVHTNKTHPGCFLRLKFCISCIIQLISKIVYHFKRVNKRMRLTAILSVLLLAGCAGSQEKPVESGPVKLSALEESAQKIETMMVEVLAIESGLRTVKSDGDPISVSYSGDATTILKKLADIEGKHFIATGRHPVSLPVSLEVKSRPIKEVLYLIGMQVGGRADVILSSRQIELRFKEWE